MNPDSTKRHPSRRDFLQAAAATSATITLAQIAAAQPAAPVPPAAAPAPLNPDDKTLPWYRRAIRWGQTNITEADVQNYDIPWWRQHWKRTNLHGIIANAGGIFAYYPSKYPQYRPPALNNRDLFGELTKAAHDDGLVVMARMDSSKCHQPLYQAHPDWFVVDANNAPARSGEFYLSCINSPYYTEFLPDVMREIIDRSHPEGFADNIWAGTERNTICYCLNCQKKFRDAKQLALPTAHNWNDNTYRQWIEWCYQRRIEQWDFNNKVTREAGGKDCLWVGMNGGNVAGQAGSFRDLKEICARSEMLLLDNQSRTDNYGLQENAVVGKLLHSLLGWDKVMPESMAMYQHGRPQYRLSTKSPPEARMWMASGFAGGIQPWWHHVAAYHEDRRMYKTAEPLMKFHTDNQKYLINRKPVTTVGIGWSQRNQDFFGRDNGEELVDQPYRGFVQALIRARIPFVPVHLDYLDRDVTDLGLTTLILPNVGLLTDAQIASIKKFAANGGNLIASGQTGLHDQWGDARPDFALADLFGVSGGRPEAPRGRGGAAGGAAAGEQHTYLRLTPELRAQAYGPKHGDEPPIRGQRHAVLAGFDDTDLLPFGSTLQNLTVRAGAQVLATFVPAFPATPPETVYMRTPSTNIPAVIVTDARPGTSGRVAYLAADLDRRFAIDNFPDHGDLLANMVRWAAGGSFGLKVEGAGLVSCDLYRQVDGANTRLVLHIVNLTSAATWRAPVHELIAVGPLTVTVQAAPGAPATRSIRALVANQKLADKGANGALATFEVPSVLDHEVIVIEG